MMRRRLAVMLVAGVLGIGLLGSPRARADFASASAQLADVLRHELGLTRSSAEIQRGLQALDYERASLEYTAVVLDHAARESMRKLASYEEVQDDRAARASERARVLYKLARGGAARLLFEPMVDDAPTRQRILAGRTLRFVVRHDLEELEIHRRAGVRARAELVAAAREAQALGAVTLVESMQAGALDAAERALDDELDEVELERRQRTRQSTRRVRTANRELLSLIRQNHDELNSLRGLDAAGDWVRPVRGAVAGTFGEYVDPVLRLPMTRSGVELDARPNERVRALADGRVVVVSSLPGLQTIVVLDHGGGQYSLTGRLWQVAVAESETVEAGDTLGRVAPKAIDDGLGPTVYLELRKGERPVDPAPYLARPSHRR